MKLYMKKLNVLLQSILIALLIYLLYRLLSKEEFIRFGHILMIILGSAGFIIIIKEAYRRMKEQKSSD